MRKRLTDEQLRARIAELKAKKAELEATKVADAAHAPAGSAPPPAPQPTVRERVESALRKRFPDHPGLADAEFDELAKKFSGGTEEVMAVLIQGVAEQRYFEAQQEAEKQRKLDLALSPEGLQQLRNFAAINAHNRCGYSDAVWDAALAALNAVPDAKLREFYLSLPDSLRDSAADYLTELVLIRHGQLAKADAIYFALDQFGFDSDRLFDPDPH